MMHADTSPRRAWPAGKTPWEAAARRAAALLSLLTMALAPALTVAHETATVPGGDPFADVIPGALAPAERAAGELSAYRMAVTLDPAAGTIGGEMTVAWRNPATQPLREVWFRLFPNGFYYGEGNLAIAGVTVDGAAVAPELALDETALRVPLPAAVAPGGSAEIALDFTATVPADSTGSYGIFNHDTDDGAWILADWYPILAVWEEGSGWALPEVTSLGDPTYSPSAFYDVAVSYPDALDLAATGVVTEEERAAGLVTRRLIAGPARDFAMVADDDHVLLTREVAGTRLTLWAAPDLDPAISEQTLDAAADALRFYNARFGPYPGREIDLVQTNPHGALGIAWSGLLFLDGPALFATYGAYNPDGLATVVAHEVAHLWWGIGIGGDSNKHGYIQEGLATASSILFIAEAFGAESAAEELEAWIIGPARRTLNAGDAVVDVPFTEGEDAGRRADATYGKGSLAFLAIRQQIGAAAFEAALRDIATRYTWGEVTPGALRAAFEAASGQDLSAFWRHWFDEAVMTSDEIDAVVAEFAVDPS